MTDCVEEQVTQHYRGKWCGFGPVGNWESVIFAVFFNTPIEGQKLIGNSFGNKSLANNEQSLARRSFTTELIFDDKVVEKGQETKGVLVGIALADVSKLRELRADIQTNSESKKVRALCILDRVEDGDFDGHATAGYAEATGSGGVSQRQLGKIRAKIRLDIADAFSAVVSPNDHRWPRYLDILLRRMASIAQVLGKETFSILNVASGPAE